MPSISCLGLIPRAALPQTPTTLFIAKMASTAGAKGQTIKFGPFDVTKQVFLKTQHVFGLVNLKPIVPGHVLICPLKPHTRLTDLSTEETTDLFSTVQLVQRMLGRIYFKSDDLTAGSFTVAVQDGPEAGQTVPHVHVHVLPRVKNDLGEQPDEVYVKMASEAGNVGGALWDRQHGRPTPGGGMPRIEDFDREARTPDDMHKEADHYRTALEEMGV